MMVLDEIAVRLNIPQGAATFANGLAIVAGALTAYILHAGEWARRQDAERKEAPPG